MKTGLKQKYATKEERENCKDLLRDSKVDEYTKEIRRLHDRYPNDKIILFDLAAHYLREDINPSEGMLYFAMAIDKKNMYSIYYEKGMYYLNHGEFGKARIEFEKLLSGNTIMQCRGIVNIIRCDIHLNYYSEDIKKGNFLGIIKTYVFIYFICAIGMLILGKTPFKYLFY